MVGERKIGRERERERGRRRDRGERKINRGTLVGVGEGDDRDGREKDRETGAGEREIGTETGVGGERERRSDRGEREKITNTKNSWNFILSCFNPVTRDKVGKIEIERETCWEREREKDITREDRILYGDRNL